MSYRPAVMLLVIVLAATGCSIEGTAGEPTTVTSPIASSSSTVEQTTSVPVTSSSSTSSTTPPSTIPSGAAICDLYPTGAPTGRVSSSALGEISGIAASRAHPGVIWAHNDSGDDAAVYALDEDGTLLGRWVLDGVVALDWEDIALGPGPEPGVDYLYAGDIGDNFRFRPDVAVYRFPEPDPTAPAGAVQAESLTLRYPDGPHDAEALMIDPVSHRLFLIVKTRGDAGIYQGPANQTPGGVDMLEPVASLDLGAEVTGADISPAGDQIALRGYRSVWMWVRSGEVGDTLENPPCLAFSPVETQGEAISFDAEGTGYFTVSEGSSPGINFVARVSD